MSRKKRRRKNKGPKMSLGHESSDEVSGGAPSEEEIMLPQEAPVDNELKTDDFARCKDESPARLPGFFAGTLELPKDRAPWPVVVLLILTAYALSVHVRMSWIEMAMSEGRESMRWEGHPTPNTHDSFYFAAILQKAHLGMHKENDMVPSVVQNGMVTMLSYGLLKVFPSLSIEELLLWVPVYASGLVCVPVVLIGRLYGSVVWGFFAACIAGVAHSYFNRTLAGYYDTDVFSVSAAAFALLFLLIALRRRSLGFALAGALSCFLYPFFYNRLGIPIALGLAFVGFQLFQAFSASQLLADKRFGRWFHLAGYVIACLYFAWFFGFEGVFGGKGGPLLAFVILLVAVLAPIVQLLREKANGQDVEPQERRAIVGFAWHSAILVGLGTATCAFAGGTKLQLSLTPFFLVLAALVSLYLVFSRISLGARVLAGAGSVALLTWVVTANPLQSVFETAERYTEAKQGPRVAGTATEKAHNLNFRNTLSTVREAGSIPWRTVLNRITADSPTCYCGRCARLSQDKGEEHSFWLPVAILALIGYGLLVLRHWEFLLALPFVGIGLYAHWGGLRFTVHATAVAALGVTYLTLSLTWAAARLAGFPWNKLATWVVAAVPTYFFVLPNIEHAKAYSSRIDVIFPKGVIEGLKALKEKSSEGDFVVTWWDYGSGTWVFSGCRTFTSPAHHRARGPDNFLVSQVLRSTSQTQSANLARLMTEEAISIPEKNKQNNTSYRTAARSLFRDGTSDVLFYPKLFAETESKDFPLPPKTRDTFLFLHYETLRIFGTIAGFSDRNLLAPEIKPKSHKINGIQLPSPFGMVLRDPKRNGNSIVFANGSRLDAKGNFHFKAGSVSRIIPVSVVQNAGEPRSSEQVVTLAASEHPIATTPRSPLRMAHAASLDRVFLMDDRMRGSTLVRKYLLDQYDEEIVDHPSFDRVFGGKLGRGNYYLLPTGYRQAGNKVTLSQIDSLGRAVNLNLDLSTAKATMPGGAVVPFSFHRLSYQGGKLTKKPMPPNPGAKYHAIQFTYPWETKSKGFSLLSTWLFLHDDLFRSTVIQGFIFENLDPELFEPVHLSPWAKIYRVKP